MPTQDFKGTVNGVVPNQIIGDGTAGRVLRAMAVLIQDGTDAAHIKCSTGSIFNGTTNEVQDNIGKDAVDTGVWNLDSSGSILTLLATGITGTLLAVLSYGNYSSTYAAAHNVRVRPLAGAMEFYFTDISTGADVDLAALVDGNGGADKVQLLILYLTSS